jgi:hypothetical protein
MNYHLNRNGHNLGVFPLEELHRRRVAGELTGAEIVWCEGMVQWQTLDVVLRQKLPGALRPGSAAAAKPKGNPAVMVVVGVMLLLFLCGLVFLGIAVARFSQRVRANLASLNQAGNAGSPGESALALASQPVAWPSNAVTAADARVKGREFRLRQYIQGYQLRGQRDPDGDELCVGFLDNWLAANYGGTFHTNLPPLGELGDRLAANPQGTDPLVLTVTAVTTEELHEKGRRLERAVSGFESSKHLAYPKFYATVALADNLVELRQDPARVPTLDTLARQRLREAFTDGSLKPGDQAELGDILVEGYGAGFFKRNQAAVVALVKDRGNDYKWLALVLEGEFEIKEAWRVRGGGYANTVTPQGWRDFARHLAQADRCLTEAWRLRPDLPLAPNLMIYTSLGESGLADMRLWFDRALAAQVDYDPAWSNLRWGLRPRWYGDPEAMLALGVTALNTRHFETDVPRKFFDSLSDLEAEQDLPVGTHLYGREDIWPQLQAMYEGYIAEPTRADEQDGWRSQYAIVAYLGGKYDVAGQQLKAIQWRSDLGENTDWGVDLSVMPLEVAARTSPQAAVVTAAETARAEGDPAAALNQYRALNAATDLDARTRAFVQERLATLALETRLQTPAWVDYLPTDTNLTGWCVERGHCQLNPDGSLDVVADKNGHLLFSRARLGREFEVRGQFEVQRSSDKSFQGGLVMGLPQFGHDNWYSFRIKRNADEGEVASFARHWTRPELVARPKLNNFTNTFYLRFQNGRVTATVNDQEVFHEATPPQAITVATNGFFLGLGAFNDMNDTVIRYRGVQVRSLANAPAPATITPFELHAR